MEKQRTSNPKISHAILCMIFSILFIFTALNISIPLTAYAEETSLGQTLNLGSFSANETDESSNEQAGYLYWAASGERSGIYYYVQDNYGKVRAHGIIMDNAYGERYGRYCTSGNVTASSKLGSVNTLGLPSVQYQPNVSPVYYSGGWQSKGSESMAYLTEIVGDIEIKGVSMPCPRWAALVANQSGGVSALDELSKPDTEWHIFVEPVSVGYLYTDDTFDVETANAVHKKDKDGNNINFAAGSPKPVGTYNADGYDVYDDPDGDGFIIDLDGSYNPNNNTTSQPAQSSEEQTVSPSGSGDGSGSSRENRAGSTLDDASEFSGRGNLQ